jgi:hypothetical protein
VTAALRFDHYDWPGGRETMLRSGPAHGPTVIVAPPLFEEANRTRALLVATLRALAERGIGGALPDLPGQGESLVATRDATMADWRRAFAAAATMLDGPVHVVAVRGGVLVDRACEAASRWHLSPIVGAAQVRELERLRSTADQPTDLFAGNDLPPALLTALEEAEPVSTRPLRTVRLADDPRPADVKIPAAPPWRTAEPQRHDILAAALADDIAAWIVTCAAF